MNLALIAVTTDGIKVAERIESKLDGEVTVFLPQKLKQSKLAATRLSPGATLLASSRSDSVGSRICGLPQGRPPDRADLEAAHRVVLPPGRILKLPTGSPQATGDRRQATYFSKKLVDQVGKIFSVYDGIIFIMASGIVVRVIASYIENKHTDPAVVVVDDAGRFVISLLSGHEGGANKLAHKVANILKTDAVITTGTEAKKDIIIGIGCKRGIGSAEVKKAICNALNNADVSIDRVRLAGTVDLKANEAGLLSALEELGIPLRVVSRAEIETCAKDYSKSDFVIKKIGVGGVCEPAALISGRKTKLILKKQKFQGVTIAVAQENFSW